MRNTKVFGQTFSRITAASLSIALLAFTASCTIDRDNNDPEISSNASSSDDKGAEEKKKENKLTSNVKDGDTEVDVAEHVQVKSNKKIEKVSLTNDAGEEVQGKFNEDKTEWTVPTKLGYARTYTLTAKSGGKKLEQTFTTIAPGMTLNGALSPLDGSTVGIGQTIALHFDAPVEDRKAVEDAITVETTPKVEGAFYWITAQDVRWRPAKYWKPGTKVKVKAELYGTKLGEGVYGGEDRTAKFTIGDDVRAIVDDKTKMMTIKKNGKTLQTMPVSMGRDYQYPTPNGTYIIGDQFETLTMDSSTFGLTGAGSYVTDVQYATQMSYSGIYIHAAPWSVYAQGNTNTSHGCINVTVENAAWVFNNMKRGDIVEVKNTQGETLNGSDGLGDWNIPWKTWKAGNTEG
ncbi:Ig-like domain-containing protein [uncultured Corynebacterium sp.]|uniref:L,D-transpeptidase n=1 Tax=uncultured Corynebacterium sp. TaxID=159447 RepID=UPI0025E13E68|nr:Ig-like domain-containing protein [uncultured Corynebacterium sp.]